MFNTFNFMAINRCCILGGPYYPTLPYTLGKTRKGTAIDMDTAVSMSIAVPFLVFQCSYIYIYMYV